MKLLCLIEFVAQKGLKLQQAFQFAAHLSAALAFFSSFSWLRGFHLQHHPQRLGWSARLLEFARLCLVGLFVPFALRPEVVHPTLGQVWLHVDSNPVLQLLQPLLTNAAAFDDQLFSHWPGSCSPWGAETAC